MSTLMTRGTCLLGAILALAGCDPTAPAPPLVERGLAVQPKGASVVGPNAVYRFRVVTEAGDTVPDDSVRWFSLRPGIAEIDGVGEATAISSGQAVIGARVAGAVVGYALLTVAIPSEPGTRWMADTLSRPTFRSVWGRTEDDLYAAEFLGLLYHWDGSAWTRVESGDSPVMYDIGGSADGDLLVAGGSKGIFHYDGSTWSRYPTDSSIFGVWAASATDAFAVGFEGAVLRYDGTDWLPMTRSTLRNLSVVWGTGADNVFAGGEGGRIAHFNGTAWHNLDTPTDQGVNAFWGSGPEDVFAGTSGGILHYDGESWTVALDWGRGIEALSGPAADDVWAVEQSGRDIFHYDGSTWHHYDASLVWPGEAVDVGALWTGPSGRTWLVGANGLVARHAPGTLYLEWPIERIGVGGRGVRGLWGFNPYDVLLGGSEIGIRRGSNGNWRPVPTLGVWGMFAVDFWGASSSDVYALGSGGDLAWWNGSLWRRLDVGIPVLRALWGASPRDVLAVGGNSAFRFNGDYWAARRTPGRLYDVWGTAADNAYAVGDSVVYRFDGDAWIYHSDTGTGPLRGLWGTAPDDIFAVGDNGRIAHYNGARWTVMESPTAARLEAVWGTAHTNVFAAGDGVVLHYDGSAWTRMTDAPVADYTNVWGTSYGPFYFTAEGMVAGLYR